MVIFGVLFALASASAIACMSATSSLTRATAAGQTFIISPVAASGVFAIVRSEEHTSELQSLMRISYAVFCLKKKIKSNQYSYSNYHWKPISNNSQHLQT